MLDYFQECSRNFIVTTAMFVFKFVYDAHCLFSCDLSECKISKLLVTEICFELFLIRVRVGIPNVNEKLSNVAAIMLVSWVGSPSIINASEVVFLFCIS